jgi:hypothetical protein
MQSAGKSQHGEWCGNMSVNDCTVKPDRCIRRAVFADGIRCLCVSCSYLWLIELIRLVSSGSFCVEWWTIWNEFQQSLSTRIVLQNDTNYANPSKCRSLCSVRVFPLCAAAFGLKSSRELVEEGWRVETCKSVYKMRRPNLDSSYSNTSFGQHASTRMSAPTSEEALWCVCRS